MIENNCITKPDQHVNILGDWTLIYDQVSAGKFESFLREISFDGFQIYEEEFKPSIFQRGEAKKDALCLGLFSKLHGNAIWRGREVFGQEILSCCNQEEIFLRTPENSAFYSLTIPFELLDQDIFDPQYFHQCHVHDNEESQIFHKKIISLMNCILENPQCIEKQDTKDQVKSDILDLTEQLFRGAYKNNSNKKISSYKATQVVKKVCSELYENHEYCHSIHDLCQITFTSRRTLQNCFEQITGQSPASFLKTMRLNAVRRSLQKGSSDICISDIASDWGFWHLSQFSTDYKKLFGESPSQTLFAFRH